MKNYLILNSFYRKIKEINRKTFIGLVESANGEKEALNKAKILFNLEGKQNIVVQECQVKYSR